MRTRLTVVLVVLLAASAGTASADIITVNWAGGANYTVIQEAVTAAGAGDTVLVASGTYSGAGNREIDFAGTDCVLMSDGGARSVTIDCTDLGRAFYFHSWETAECVVEGFTITNGAQVYGGAMHFMNSSPTIRDCVITESVATIRGGGIFCTSLGNPTFTECTFSSNQSVIGGAASCDMSGNPYFEDCTFSDNTAQSGAGAVWISDAYPTFLVCGFTGNGVTGDFTDGGAVSVVDGASPLFSGCSFNTNTAPYLGGAVLVYDHSFPTFSGCSFSGNIGTFGGAVGMYGTSSPTFSTCWFSGNAAFYSGGAVVVQDGSTPSFDECTFDDNVAAFGGGALSSEYIASPSLTGCTLYANSAPNGSGIWCDSGFSLTNCIIAFGTTGAAVHCVGAPPVPACSDIYGNAGGDWVGCLAGLDLVDDNLSEDPLFCNALVGDFYLDVASPCTAANASSCGRIGAWGIDCDSPVQAQSWGSIKAMYR